MKLKDFSFITSELMLVLVSVGLSLSYLGFFLLFGIFMLTYHSASSNLSENPIIQKITH